jgi:hypothetical protein
MPVERNTSTDPRRQRALPLLHRIHTISHVTFKLLNQDFQYVEASKIMQGSKGSKAAVECLDYVSAVMRKSLCIPLPTTTFRPNNSGWNVVQKKSLKMTVPLWHQRA